MLYLGTYVLEVYAANEKTITRKKSDIFLVKIFMYLGLGLFNYVLLKW